MKLTPIDGNRVFLPFSAITTAKQGHHEAPDFKIYSPLPGNPKKRHMPFASWNDFDVRGYLPIKHAGVRADFSAYKYHGEVGVSSRFAAIIEREAAALAERFTPGDAEITTFVPSYPNPDPHNRTEGQSAALILVSEPFEDSIPTACPDREYLSDRGLCLDQDPAAFTLPLLEYAGWNYFAANNHRPVMKAIKTLRNYTLDLAGPTALQRWQIALIQAPKDGGGLRVGIYARGEVIRL